jgi:hypothetical protein
MDLPRRRVLRGIFGMTVASATPIRWIAPAVAATGAGGWLSKASYPPLVGSTFAVTTGTGTTASLRLLAIRDIGGAPSDGRFSLLFVSASAFVQGTYPVRQKRLGEANLFVVPVGGHSAPQKYEVIVNRLA